MVRAKIIKRLEENIDVNLHDLGFGHGFSYVYIYIYVCMIPNV
jgi:hypothetical protein